MTLRFDNIRRYEHNCIAYRFCSRFGLEMARIVNPVFNEMIGLVLDREDGSVTVLTFGWWNYQETTGLPPPRPLKTCLYGVARDMLRRDRSKMLQKCLQMESVA